jgi:hypothetical protein
MKATELIDKLQKLVERDGDSEIIFLVGDYFTAYGHEAKSFGYDPKRYWEYTTFNPGTKETRFSIWLEPNRENKKPKVIFLET